MKIEELITWYSNLSPETVHKVRDIYDEQAQFIDPFNDVTGHEAIADIFHHMFETTDKPRFEITDVVQENQTAWVNWIFSCEFRARPIEIEGASRLDFAEDGRVLRHHDFLNAAELLTQVPFIGTIVRYINNKMSVSAQYNREHKKHERRI
jgi:hypothetical protein